MSSNTATRPRRRSAAMRRMAVLGTPSRQIDWGERIPLDGGRGGLHLDMSAVEFADPTMAVRLAAVRTLHEQTGRPFAISPPPATPVRRYLARAGLGRLVGEEPCAGGADMLLPVTHLRRQAQIDPLGEELEVALGKLPRGLAAGAAQLNCAFSELCLNACTHGKSDHGAFVMLQRLGPDHLVLVVGDLGVGIPDHVVGHLPDLAGFNEGRRIANALRLGVSGAGAKRGDGLARIVESIRKAGKPAGELRIWSGTGRVRMRPGERRANDWTVGSRTQGTWAEFLLSSGT